MKPDQILLIDSECTTCSRFGRFVLENSQKIQVGPLPEDGFRSSLFIYNGKVIHGTDAILKVFTYLGFPYPLLAKILRILPRSIRDFVYYQVTRYRRLLKIKNSCLLPSSDIGRRIISRATAERMLKNSLRTTFK